MKNGSCPDPEALAAWIDQGVMRVERVLIESHLASCDDCRHVIVHVLQLQDASPRPLLASMAAALTF